MKPQPQFLRIRWEDTPEQGAAVTREAMLCLRHRGEIALAFASARGCGEMGYACDFCAGRDPRPRGAELSHPRRSQLGSLTASLARPGRSRLLPSDKPGIGALLQGARGDCGVGVTVAQPRHGPRHGDVAQGVPERPTPVDGLRASGDQ